MSFLKSVLTRLRDQKANRRRKSRVDAMGRLSFTVLESRKLLATGMTLDTATNDLTIFGDDQGNTGRIEVENGQYKAEISGAATQYFPLTAVDKVIFIGLGGNDTFTNDTALESELVGHGGNDWLRGGSGVDVINGGEGDDNIRGNGGNDRIVGAAGNDLIFGGDGDDDIFGSFTGTNTIYGEAGNDTIYGGNLVDTIFGGDGVDKIFALDGNDIIDSGAGGTPSYNGNDVTAQGDLVLGLGGNDMITGGGGWDVLYGGLGQDTITGGSGQNWIFGQENNDTLTGGVNNNVGGQVTIDYIRGNDGDDSISGGDGVDVLFGDAGNDNLFGGNGNDILNGYLGDDTMNGQAGDDIAELNGNQSAFKVTGESTRQISRDTRANVDGQDTIRAVETLKFVSGSVNAGPLVAERVQINPIIVSNDNGTNTAAMFGDAATEARIKDLIDFTMYEANVDVQWLSTKTWNNTYANIGNGGTRPVTDLEWVVDNGDNAGIGSTNTLILDMYFVQVSAGFNNTGDNVVNGIAFDSANGITLHVGDNLLNSESGIAAVARVALHEIAHNLGLGHVSAPADNLMQPSPVGDGLTSSQKATIIASQYTVPFTN